MINIFHNKYFINITNLMQFVLILLKIKKMKLDYIILGSKSSLGLLKLCF